MSEVSVMTQAVRCAVRLMAVFIASALVLSVTGCKLWQPEVPSDTTIAQSALPRDTDPDVESEDIEALVSGNSAFAFDLLHEITEDDANLFFSPYSISSALAMAVAGARGATEEQMADVLHFTLDSLVLHPCFNWLDLELNSRDEIGPPYEGEGFQLSVVNAVWGQQGYPFLDPYLDLLAVNYGAGLRLVDFLDNPHGSRLTINDWVSDQTNARIQDLLAPGSITSDTRLVLTNAIYFLAPWLVPFDEELTANAPFTLLSGDVVSVPMMHLDELVSLKYAKWESGVAVELPYNGETLSMVILVPDAGEFEAFEQSLTAERYEDIVSSLGPRQVNLGFPKFEFTYDVSLVEPLTALGINDAFLPGTADFSGIDGSRDLLISDVLHKAFVSVDEAGTEAAAATAVIFEFTAIPGPPVTLTVDQPFLFVIRDVPTGTILFIGRVVAP
jgi:serpin B